MLTINDVIKANELVASLQDVIQEQDSIISDLRKLIEEYQNYLEWQINELRDTTFKQSTAEVHKIPVRTIE